MAVTVLSWWDRLNDQRFFGYERHSSVMMLFFSPFSFLPAWVQLQLDMVQALWKTTVKGFIFFEFLFLNFFETYFSFKQILYLYQWNVVQAVQPESHCFFVNCMLDFFCACTFKPVYGCVFVWIQSTLLCSC